MQNKRRDRRAPVHTAPEERAHEELIKNKPLEVSHIEDMSSLFPEDRHPWKFVHCYRCGDRGHFAYECPQKGKPEQEILCASCNHIGHYFNKCSRRKEAQYQNCYYCGEEGHFVRQCPLQENWAPPTTSVPEDKFEEPKSSHQKEINYSGGEGKVCRKTVLTHTAPPQCASDQAITTQAEEERTIVSPIRLSQEFEELELGRIDLKALHLQAPCRPQNSGHKRKMKDRVQDIVKASKTRMMVGSSFPNKALRAKVQCFKCSDIGHYASRCPRRRPTIAPDSLPEVTLIATITPAAGRKANARIMSRVQEYRRLGLPMPQDEAVKYQASSSTSKLSTQGQPQQKFFPIKNVTCFYCKELGHYANKCPMKQQAMESTSPDVSGEPELCEKEDP